MWQPLQKKWPIRLLSTIKHFEKSPMIQKLVYKRHWLTLLITSCVLVGSSGCSLLPKAYRIDIPQGNLITKEKVNDIQLGMNRRQVQRIMGSPMLVDTFDQDRWDYFYSVNDVSGTQIEHHITVVFADGTVTNIITNK